MADASTLTPPAPSLAGPAPFQPRPQTELDIARARQFRETEAANARELALANAERRARALADENAALAAERTAALKASEAAVADAAAARADAAAARADASSRSRSAWRAVVVGLVAVLLFGGGGGGATLVGWRDAACRSDAVGGALSRPLFGGGPVLCPATSRPPPPPPRSGSSSSTPRSTSSSPALTSSTTPSSSHGEKLRWLKSVGYDQAVAQAALERSGGDLGLAHDDLQAAAAQSAPGPS